MTYTIKDITFRPAESHSDYPVKYGRRRTIERRLKAYDVILDGVMIGRVFEAMATFERKTRGRTYVNSRWRSPRWYQEQLGQMTSFRTYFETRKQAAEALLWALHPENA